MMAIFNALNKSAANAGGISESVLRYTLPKAR